nr:putative ribonuclease H-like domain-containing protein [Tanacetum cinerariifolium]
MYGLHQAPRAWYGTLSKYLLKNGFQKGTIDQTLFIRRQREDFILVQVYVDDIIFGSSNPQLCREFEALMHEKFQMSAMGELNFFHGLQVLQKEHGIFLSQDKKGKEIIVESDTPKKKKLQEQIDAQMARELEEQKKREDLRMNEQITRDAEVARIHAEEEIQGMIDSLDKSNETIEDFTPMGSKEEAGRAKRQGIILEKEQVKKQKLSEEAPESKTPTEEVSEDRIKEMMQLVSVEDVYVQALQVKHPIIDWKVHSEGERTYWQIIRLGGNTACYQFFVDLLRQLDREDL